MMLEKNAVKVAKREGLGGTVGFNMAGIRDREP
jgi:hypothetical protein